MPSMIHRARDLALPLMAKAVRRPESTPDDVVLILQPDHLGDVVFSQPAVGHIREQFPESRLIAVVGPWSREVVELMWPVDEVRTLAFPGFARRDRNLPLAPYRLLYSAARELESLRARAAVVLRPDAWWAAWLASMIAPTVITGDEPRTVSFATTAAPVPQDDHAVVRAFTIALAVTGGTRFQRIDPVTRPLFVPTSPPAAAQARTLLHDEGIDSDYVVIHPGSGAPVKEWPVHRWKTVAGDLARDGFRIVATGTESEAGLCQQVIAGLEGAATLAGRTPLPVLAEVIRGAALVAGPDSGPLHLAVAAGVPTVHLFGPSDPARYGPWGDRMRHRVVRAGWTCPRCGDLSLDRGAGCGCMLAIPPSMVTDTIRGLLETCTTT